METKTPFLKAQENSAGKKKKKLNVSRKVISYIVDQIKKSLKHSK